LAWFLEHLVHECSHLHLNPLFSLDPLLYNPNEIHLAPIRPDPRPMFQILHGTFVLATNCRVHARLCERFPELNLQPALEKFYEQFQRGIAVVEGCMKPTPRGALLLQSLSEAAA
jgi:HEXXH motif-containing protein